jgi:hypothetical protein
MKRKVGKELEGGIKKRKEVGNDNPSASMYARQHVASDLNRASEANHAPLQKENDMLLDEAGQAERGRRSENDTHDIEGTDTCTQQCQNEVWTVSASYERLRSMR